ncbi:MAG: response regulator [Chloroflexota bacterium]|jgi:response regulator RpfG family c-di-GMP phosphodiesterase
MKSHKKVVCINSLAEPATENLNNILEHHGFEVIHTRHTEIDVHTVCRETPDVVLLDLSNCHPSVWEMYHKIRESMLTCNIPVILIAAKATCIEDLQRLYAANAAAYLIKPIQPQELLFSIEHTLLN